MPYVSGAQPKSIQLGYSKIEYVVDGSCWNVVSHKPNNSGYPAKHSGLIHREMYKKYKGEIPNNKLVCHTCDNRLCINPDHLWLGTHAENQLDKLSKNRQSRLGGERNGRAKLTAAQVGEIINDKRTIKKIAADYGVAFTMISRIKRKEAWNAI